MNPAPSPRHAQPRKATGKLAVLMPGMGAVATTTMAGVMLSRRGLGAPVGSLTQLGRVRVHDEARAWKEVLPLASLADVEFGGWDLFPEDALAAARHAEVLSKEHLDLVADELAAVRPMEAVFYPEYVSRLHGTHVKRGKSKAELVEALQSDIRGFIKQKGADRAVAVWCGSTEKYLPLGAVHESVRSFERGLRENDPSISPAQMYAWACLKERVPFANGSPNLGVESTAALELAREMSVAVSGKDFKTGQTLMKTVIAPGLKARQLGLNGWYSTNILGNRDGEVLDDPENFRAKEHTKLGVLDSILEPEDQPELYGKFHHKVRIDYYPPRGDQKEGWDNIDFFGWMGYPMQIKVNFLCRDSILAAPIVLDLALLMDLAQRADMSGMQEWLSFYFKSPMTRSRRAQHDLFAQYDTLRRTLRSLGGLEETAFAHAAE